MTTTADEMARRLAAMSPGEIHAEECRQTDELAERIAAVIDGHGLVTPTPMLTAIFAALLRVEAEMLAGLAIEQRRIIIAKAKAARPKILAQALAQNPPRIQTVTKARCDA